MNLDRAAIVLRPRSVSEICDLAVRLTFSIALPLYAKLSAIVLLPMFAAMMALRYYSRWQWFYVWLLAIPLAGLAQGVFTVAAGRLMFSEDLGVGEVLRAFGRRAGSYFFAYLLSRGLIVLSAIPIVSLPFAWIAMVFVHEASLLEGAGPGQALSRASRFVRGRGVDAVALLFFLLLAQGAAVLMAEGFGQAVLDDLFQMGKPFGSLWDDKGSPFALLGLFMMAPILATVRFLQYIDTRTRADGWDIQVRFLGVAAKDSSERRLAA